MQYAGTPALRKATAPGEKEGVSNSLTSAKRFFIGKYLDHAKQRQLDLLGSGVPIEKVKLSRSRLLIPSEKSLSSSNSNSLISKQLDEMLKTLRDIRNRRTRSLSDSPKRVVSIASSVFGEIRPFKRGLMYDIMMNRLLS